MLSISSTGSSLSSIEQLIQQSLVKEREPVLALESQKKELNRRTNVFTDLKSKLKSLRDVAKDFGRIGSLNKLRSKSAVSSDTSFLTVSASAAALTGNHSILVNRLASSDTGVSNQFTRDTVGGFTSGLHEFSLAVGTGDPQTISVTIDPADTNETVLQKIADAVNAAGLEASASIIYDSSLTARLIFKSNETGSENALSLSELNGSTLLQDLGLVDALGARNQSGGTGGGFLLQNSGDLDAKIKFDGIDIVKGSNEITDIINGVTIKLRHVQAADDEPLSITISNDTETVKSEIEKFIEKYNDAIKYLNVKTKVDTTTFKRGDLTGDIIFGGLKFSIRGLVSQSVEDLPSGEMKFLSQIGISLARDGTMSIKDSSKFDEALNNNIDEVIQLFSADDGVGNKITGLLNSFVKTGGQVDRSKKGVKRQISSIDTRISNYEARLKVREESLRRQFTSLQRSLSLLNSQQAMMQSYQMINFRSYLNY